MGLQTPRTIFCHKRTGKVFLFGLLEGKVTEKASELVSARKQLFLKFSKVTFSSFLGCSNFKHSINYTPYGTPKSFLKGFPVFALAESLFF